MLFQDFSLLPLKSELSNMAYRAYLPGHKLHKTVIWIPHIFYVVLDGGLKVAVLFPYVIFSTFRKIWANHFGSFYVCVLQNVPSVPWQQ